MEKSRPTFTTFKAKALKKKEIVSAPVSFGHRAGVDMDSAPEHMWTPRRSACGHFGVLTGA